VERFRREAQNAASLNHPNIVAVYDWGQEAGTYFIVMEYVEGQSLRDVLRAQGTVPPIQAAGIAAEIADALAFAHHNGVVHRDIKPGNVLITPSGQVKVTDFGIAANRTEAHAGLTQTGAVMGTATYFSPEQAQGFAVDGRTDVYALGVVLYEMVTGAPPFQAESPVAVAMKHVREPPAAPSTLAPDLPPDLERIILAAMAKDVASRYQSAEAMRDDLVAFERGRPVTAAYAATVAGTGAAPTQMWEPPKRRWGSIVAVCIGLGLLAAVLVVLLVPPLRDQVIGSSGSSTPSVEVPDVTTGNPTFLDAQTKLVAAGFKVTRVDAESDTVSPDHVIKQNPPAGDLLQKGKHVTVTVANNQVTLPNVVGETATQAQSTLQGLGLTVQQVQQPTPNQAAGNVLSMNPPAGTKTTRGTTVTLTVSEMPQVTVPAVTGQSQVTASNTLQALGLQVQITPQNSTTVPAGQVISSNPPAGTMVAKGSSVQLIVSTGPQTVAVPNVIGQTSTNAIHALTGAGLSVQASCSPSGTTTVISQNPTAGTQVNPGSTVAITCSS